MLIGVKNLRIVMDSLINVFIIFTFLVLFNYFCIRPVKTRAIQIEFKKALYDGITIIDPDFTRQLLLPLAPAAATLERAFRKPDPLTRVTNLTLLALALTVSICLAIVISVVAAFAHCFEIPLRLADIISKNIWSFIIVAIIEVIFFFAVAKDYVVTPPSHLADTVLRALHRDGYDSCTQKDISCNDVWPCVTDRNMRIAGACFGTLFTISIILMCVGPGVQLRGRAYERTGS